MTPRLDARVCLGLLLVITGIRTLTSPVHTLLVVSGMEWDSGMMLVSALPVAMTVLQIVAGCAFAFRKPTAGWLALAGHVVVTVSFLVFLVFDGLADGGAITLGTVVFEVLATPVIVVVALAIAKPSGSSARREVGAILIVLAISTLLNLGVRVLWEVRSIIELAPPGTTVLARLGWIVPYAVVALLGLRAGVRLSRGTAKRDLGIWVIAVIANEVLLLVIFAGYVVFDDQDVGSTWLATKAIGAFLTIAFPGFLWVFVRSHADAAADADADRHVPMLPAWNALLFVPFLLTRPFLADTIAVWRSETVLGDVATLLLTAGFAVLAAANAATAILALRERPTVVALAVISTALGVVITSGLVVIMQTETVEPVHTGPFLQIVVTTAVLAWLHRTAQPAIPRAVATR